MSLDGDSGEYVTSLLDDAAGLLHDGENRKALEVLELAVEIVLKDVSTNKLSGLLDTVMKDAIREANNVAMSQLKSGASLSLTLQYLRKAETWLKYLDPTNSLHSTTYSNIANAYRTKSEFDVALKFAEKALKISKKNMAHDGDSLSCAHLTMCCILSQLESHEEALEHAQLAVSNSLEFLVPIRKGSKELIFRYTEQIVTLCIAYHNVGVQYEFLQRVRDALPWYQRAKETAEKYISSKESMIASFTYSLQAAEKMIREGDDDGRRKGKSKNHGRGGREGEGEKPLIAIQKNKTLTGNDVHVLESYGATKESSSSKVFLEKKTSSSGAVVLQRNVYDVEPSLSMLERRDAIIQSIQKHKGYHGVPADDASGATDDKVPMMPARLISIPKGQRTKIDFPVHNGDMNISAVYQNIENSPPKASFKYSNNNHSSERDRAHSPSRYSNPVKRSFQKHSRPLSAPFRRGQPRNPTHSALKSDNYTDVSIKSSANAVSSGISLTFDELEGSVERAYMEEYREAKQQRGKRGGAPRPYSASASRGV